jgi:hypothetical protein
VVDCHTSTLRCSSRTVLDRFCVCVAALSASEFGVTSLNPAQGIAECTESFNQWIRCEVVEVRILGTERDRTAVIGHTLGRHSVRIPVGGQLYLWVF